MSYGLVFGALAAVLLFIGCMAGLVWWVRRPLRPARRDGPRVLPLFGHDRAALYGRSHDGEDEEDDKAQLIEARTALSASSSEHEAAHGASDGMQEGRFSPPTWSPQRYRTPMATSSGAAQGASAHNGAPMSTASAVPSFARQYTRPRPSQEPIAPRTAPQMDSSHFDGRSIRFSVPTDSTLQFLPGKLDIVGGHDRGREIRFVRTPGPDGIDVTFGRSEGPAYRHIQLHDATVSRAHARMSMHDGRWLLANLSTTNPVLLNGEVVATDAEQALTDGDRIEMGEVVFRFRA